MNIRLIVVGKTALPFIREGIAMYLDRLRRYIPAELIEVQSASSSDREVIIRSDSLAIGKHLRDTDHVVLFDEKGTLYSSHEFGAWMQKKMNSGSKTLVFVTGGAYGVSDEIRKRANEIISFSPMTFTHDMIRLIALEQLYRAHTIIRGEKYHH